MEYTLAGPLWEGFCESRRCAKDTYPESHITEYILIYEDITVALGPRSRLARRSGTAVGVPSAVRNLGFRVWGLGFRFQISGLRVEG